MAMSPVESLAEMLKLGACFLSGKFPPKSGDHVSRAELSNSSLKSPNRPDGRTFGGLITTPLAWRFSQTRKGLALVPDALARLPGTQPKSSRALFVLLDDRSLEP